MKSFLKIVLISIASLFVISCSSTETKAKKVAERALNKVANGRYLGYPNDLLFSSLSFDPDFEPEYSIDNYRAVLFQQRKDINYKEMNLDNDALIGQFFNINRYSFKRFNYFKTEKHIQDFYVTHLASWLYSNGVPASLIDFWKDVEDLKDRPGFEQSGYDYIVINKKDVPVYRFIYEADNLYWVHVTVACFKGLQPIVTSLRVGPIQIGGTPVSP